MTIRFGCAAVALTLAAFRVTAAAPAPVLEAALQTERILRADSNSAVVVLNSTDAGRSRIVATAQLGGLEIYDLAGKRLGAAPAGEATSVDVAYGFAIGARQATVLAALDGTDNSLRLYTMEGDALTEAGARSIPLGFAVEGVCLHRSALDGSLYAFVVGDGGEIDQQLIYADAAGKLDARQVRRISVPSTLKQCVVDREGQVYAAEEAVGIWRFTANAEADTSARLIDGPGIGHIEEEVKGLALYDGGDGSRWLLASNSSAGLVNVYDRSRDDAYVGTFAVRPKGGAENLAEPGTLFATSVALGAQFPHGLLLVTDENGGDYKVVPFAALGGALSLALGTAQDSRPLAVPPVPGGDGDVRNRAGEELRRRRRRPGDLGASHRSGPQPRPGHRQEGRAQRLRHAGEDAAVPARGKMNNIDLRDGFRLGGKPVTLVTASDRTNKAIGIFRLDPEARALVDVADGLQPTDLKDPYGLCMYRSAKSGKTYVFINSGDGPMKQWELVDAGNGRGQGQAGARMALRNADRGLRRGRRGRRALRRRGGRRVVALRRRAGRRKTGVQVDRVDRNKRIKDDIEGMGLYDPRRRARLSRGVEPGQRHLCRVPARGQAGIPGLVRGGRERRARHRRHQRDRRARRQQCQSRPGFRARRHGGAGRAQRAAGGKPELQVRAVGVHRARAEAGNARREARPRRADGGRRRPAPMRFAYRCCFAWACRSGPGREAKRQPARARRSISPTTSPTWRR
jgi:3-phytase